LERAENYARFIDVNFNLSLELPPNELQQWQPLLLLLGLELYDSLNSVVEKVRLFTFLAFEERNPNSIYNCILNAREMHVPYELKSQEV
jgi:uncharacterized alpha-E superfamily protein